MGNINDRTHVPPLFPSKTAGHLSSYSAIYVYQVVNEVVSTGGAQNEHENFPAYCGPIGYFYPACSNCMQQRANGNSGADSRAIPSGPTGNLCLCGRNSRK